MSGAIAAIFIRKIARNIPLQDSCGLKKIVLIEKMTAKEDFLQKKHTVTGKYKNRTWKLKCINCPNLRHTGGKRSFIFWGLKSFLNNKNSLWLKSKISEKI
jgi:hypothetical protein